MLAPSDSGSIFGVGASKRLSAARRQVAKRVVMAWVITIPATAVFGGLAYLLVSQIWK